MRILKENINLHSLYVDGHAELLLTVRSLMYLSMRVIDTYFETDDILERKKGVRSTNIDNCQ